MKARAYKTVWRPAAKSWGALLAAWTLGLVAVAQAGDTASAGYRVTGNLVPAAGGALHGASYELYHVVAQPDVLGDAAAPGQMILHGWRIPTPVERLFRYALAAGWNLKGSPGVSDQAIGPIFTGAAGAPIKVGDLQYATANGGLVTAADSDPLVELQAFWVFSYWGGIGQSFATPDAHTPDDGTSWRDLLQPGWNLFSPPYVVTVPARGTGIVIVWRWDSARSTYQVVLPGQNLLPLEGYWIFVAVSSP